jgi:Rrf2 family nitric oxide-sensitive transcriptional repressor
MYITRHTDYSLRVLIYLAVQGDSLTTIQQISDSYGISKNHLMKVVHELNKKGYVETVRGKNGGLRLGVPPESIRIGVLVREMESGLDLVECFSQENTCVINPVCGLKSILNEGINAFFDKLDEYTLRDVLPDKFKPQLLRILNIH